MLASVAVWAWSGASAIDGVLVFDTVSFLMGVVAAVVVSLLLATLEPVKLVLARWSARLAGVHGVETHVELDPGVIYAGFPDWIGYTYFVPGDHLETNPPSNPRLLRDWVLQKGGCPLQVSEARVTLVATGQGTIVVETPVVDVLQEDIPIGTKLLRRAAGGADVYPKGFDVQLDTFGIDTPFVELVDESGEPRTTPLTWSLAQGQVETFHIRVISQTAALFLWRAQIPLIANGRRVYVDVDDAGQRIVLAGGDLRGCLGWDGQVWADER